MQFDATVVYNECKLTNHYSRPNVSKHLHSDFISSDLKLLHNLLAFILIEMYEGVW